MSRLYCKAESDTKKKEMTMTGNREMNVTFLFDHPLPNVEEGKFTVTLASNRDGSAVALVVRYDNVIQYRGVVNRDEHLRGFPENITPMELGERR